MNSARSLIATQTILSRPKNVGVLYNTTALMENLVHTCQLVERFEGIHTYIHHTHAHKGAHTRTHRHTRTQPHTGARAHAHTHTGARARTHRGTYTISTLI
jgi:hypothetical protein